MTPEEIIRTVEAVGALIVPILDEIDWAHVWTKTPSGSIEPVADFHLPCKSVTGLTQVQPDGSTRHICRECARDTAIKAAGG